MATIEPALPGDVVHIRRIASAVFEQYGDYAKILPRFFSSQGVTSYVAKVGQEVVGFVMLGFLPWTGGDCNSDSWVADILALAVAPERQRQGIGCAMMSRTFELAQEMSDWRDVREIQLTCAKSNQAGAAFFAKWGFLVVESNHGSYSSGQPAMRLSRSFTLRKDSRDS